MKPKHQRLIMLVAALASVALGVGLLLRHFSEQLIFYYNPAQLQTEQEHLKDKQVIRIGGLVKEHTIIHEADGSMTFVITDGTVEVTVHYQGLLPSLFREGQGVVAQGILNVDGTFNAASLLAKHDEKYMPPEVAKTLKESGHWNPN